MLHELVVAKDCYETPAWVWSYYVRNQELTVDVHASAFNAVAPRYLTAADGVDALDEPVPRARKSRGLGPPAHPPLPTPRPLASRGHGPAFPAGAFMLCACVLWVDGFWHRDTPPECVVTRERAWRAWLCWW